nr:PREDICTED: uncharacterized protein LOC107076681 [Lepisosteus oculatus]XP_015196723.1 PREDICTED: uncharacterized protein LOC107076681 [Lepisosteus oculatus]XP_015196724.1 PREDICTED: uncharacterized protein LOC107076681 [Lepisosteus oculatus]
MEAITLRSSDLILFFCLLCADGGVTAPDSLAPCEWKRLGGNVTEVNCRSRGLQTVPANLPTQASAIELSSNRITRVLRSDFPPLAPSTVRLNLSRNWICEIQDGALAGFVNLEVLDLSRNRLGALQHGPWRGLVALTELHLGHNAIVNIPPSAFDSLAGVEELWLQDNSLVSVPQALKRTPSLRVLSLSHNRIMSIDSGDLRPCRDLAVLHLEHNAISRVAEDAFEGLGKLQRLNLSCNMLGTVPPAALQELWERGADVVLGGNTWVRDRRLQELKVQVPAWPRCQGEPLQGLQPPAPRGGRRTCRRPLRVSPLLTVQLPADRGLTLACKTASQEGQILYWQTPWGQLKKNASYSSWDPVKVLRDGSLRIVKPVVFHTGLYYCLFSEREQKTIVPYRVDFGETRDVKGVNLRKTREASRNEDTVSERDFISAVAVSVALSFLGGFVLGAFSRSYLNRCCKNMNPQNNIRGDSNMKLDTLPHQYENPVMGHSEDSEATVVYESLSLVRSAKQGVTLTTNTLNVHDSRAPRVGDVSKEPCVVDATLEKPPLSTNTLYAHPESRANSKPSDGKPENTGVPVSPSSAGLGRSEFSQNISARYEELETASSEGQGGKGSTDIESSAPVRSPKNSMTLDSFGSTAAPEERKEEGEYIVFPVEDVFKVVGSQTADALSPNKDTHFKTVPLSAVPQERPSTLPAEIKFEMPAENDVSKTDHSHLSTRPSSEELRRWKGASEDDDTGSTGSRVREETTSEKDQDARAKVSQTFGICSNPLRDEEETGEGNAVCRAVSGQSSPEEDSETEREEGHPTNQEHSMNENEENKFQEEREDNGKKQARVAKRRVIKLYNYDEEGKLYGHIKDPDEYRNTPRLKQRSLSLTRLNAIMTAETGQTTEHSKHSPVDSPLFKLTI